MRIVVIGALIASVGGHALAQTSSPGSAPSAPAAAPAPAAAAPAAGAPATGSPALSPTPGTPAPGGFVQPPRPGINSTPSQSNVEVFPPSRLTNPGGPAAPPNQAVPGQQIATGQVPLGQQSSGGRPQPGGANSSAPQGQPKKTGSDYVADCMRLWDAATHMTKAQWRVACKRVQNRLDNLKVIAQETRGKRQRRGDAGRGSSN